VQIVFRADSSIQTGSGHIMRCLTLADELRISGCEILFICRGLPGNLISLIEKKNYSVCKLNWQEEGNLSIGRKMPVKLLAVLKI
jgi:spore coat polysaccharide biosynthesis predicted glycosyltransferase SpsG